MTEPTVSALTLVTAATVTVAGVSLGLRADVLLAGFCGSVTAMVLLNSVPSDDTRPTRTAVKRLMVALSSAMTAGYLAPVAIPVDSEAAKWTLPTAFLVGAFAMRLLPWLFDRLVGKRNEP